MAHVRTHGASFFADLQRAAEEGFRAGGFNGAAVVMDPRTGEVLAFTSRPGYNPNDFAAGIDRSTWAGLNSDTLSQALEGPFQLSPGHRPGYGEENESWSEGPPQRAARPSVVVLPG